jgi:sugar lactone lactonase YvrE
MTASLLNNSNCILGEGAFWHGPRQSFLWVDIDGKQLHEYVLQSQKVNSGFGWTNGVFLAMNN